MGVGQTILSKPVQKVRPILCFMKIMRWFLYLDTEYEIHMQQYPFYRFT